MASYREPGQTGRDVFENATESVTAQAASGNPLSILSVRDALIVLGKARDLPRSAIAKELRISRETLYQHLRKATAQLQAVLERRPAGPPVLRCRCGKRREPGRGRCAACWREYQRLWVRQKRTCGVDSPPPDSGDRQ